MKKFLIILIILILASISLFFIIKNNYLNMYYNKNINYEKSSDIITINKRNAKKYISYNSIKIENIFDKYILEDGNYILLDEDEQLLEMFNMDRTIPLIDLFKDGLEKYDNNDDFINQQQREAILKDNSINNDKELLEYMIDYLKKELDIHSSFNDIKTYAYINKFMSNVIPLMEDYAIIDGDYNGIIINDLSMEHEHYTDVYLYHNNERYVFSFMGSNLSEEEIINLIGTVIFDEE